MRGGQCVYLIQWDDVQGTFKYHSAEMALKDAEEFLARQMACTTVGEARNRVQTLNALMTSEGKTSDHFITPVSVDRTCTCPGNAARGITHQHGCTGNPPSASSTEEMIRRIIREELHHAHSTTVSREGR